MMRIENIVAILFFFSSSFWSITLSSAYAPSQLTSVAVKLQGTTSKHVVSTPPFVRNNSFISTASTRSSSSPTRLEAASLSQYAPQAISLFNNMITPASIIAGAMVPIGLLEPLSVDEQEDEVEANLPVWQQKLHRTLRSLYIYAATFSFASELMTVVWATIAINQLTERSIAPAESVWHLLQRDFDLEWAATNAHFVAGLLGFVFMVGTRSYFNAQGGPLGRSVFGTAFSALLLMVAVINRGVTKGGGRVSASYGTSIISLILHYLTLLWKRATTKTSFGSLELLSMSIFAYSVQGLIRRVVRVWSTNSTKTTDSTNKLE